jgi:hypothetical protein
MMNVGFLGAIAAIVLAQTTAPPAVPKTAVAAILDAFKDYDVVGLGDAHGNRQGDAFRRALIDDPRFAATVNDVVVEAGNARYQSVVDRYINGGAVPQEEMARVWLDTTQQQAASKQIPEVVTAIRALNQGRIPAQRLRVLLGEPPLDWDRIKTADEWHRWEEDPKSDREWFGAEIVKTEVVAKKRKGLLLYGAGHFFRKPAHQSIVTLLAAAGTRVFTVWTNAAAEMAKMQPDVAAWTAPSLAPLRGTVLGKINLSEFLGPNAGDVPPQWLAPIEEQFDAVLYLGPLSTLVLDRPQPWPCADPAWDERVRRLRLQRGAFADRVRQACAQP